mmetsp:Transcript_7060/g.11233  ORF Transcript_7060/g.11233 Transcript_7060/m.11233 type:complete len:295 (-) Transcript_7060:450-1334(-)
MFPNRSLNCRSLTGRSGARDFINEPYGEMTGNGQGVSADTFPRAPRTPRRRRRRLFSDDEGKRRGMTTVSVDFKPSQAAMVSHQLDIDKPVSEQVAGLRASLVQELVCPHERHLGGGAGLVVHAAGAFALGALDADDCLATAAALYRANVESAILTAHLATHLLTPKGLLILTGALGAVHPTPEFVGYGASKAATHHLVQSAAASDSARQGQWDVLGLLPRVIDTPSNRLTMPDADRSDWTELDDLAEICADWYADEGGARPPSGALVQVQTFDGLTTWTPLTVEGVQERQAEI